MLVLTKKFYRKIIGLLFLTSLLVIIFGLGIVSANTSPNHYENTLQLEPGVTVTQIAASGGHTCALLSSGKVKCWGL